MKTHSTIILKENGAVRWLGRRLEDITALLSNGRYVVTVKKEVKPRSQNQNRLMWMWFACIADATGNTAQEVHDAYCYMFLSREVQMGNRKGLVPSGTSGLRTDEMKDFLDRVQADAASELGIQLPDPDDLRFQAFVEEYGHRI